MRRARRLANGSHLAVSDATSPGAPFANARAAPPQ